MLDITVDLYCDRCDAETSVDVDDLNTWHELDEKDLPEGWASADDGQHLCPKCLDPKVRNSGVCGDLKPSTSPAEIAPQCYCRREPGHPGDCECHFNHMTWHRLGAVA